MAHTRKTSSSGGKDQIRKPSSVVTAAYGSTSQVYVTCIRNAMVTTEEDQEEEDQEEYQFQRTNIRPESVVGVSSSSPKRTQRSR